MATATMPAPATDPTHRAPATISSPATYAHGAPVWIFRRGAWRPGLVVASSELAALVEYRYTGSLARGTDTAVARDLAVRDEYDPYLDPAPLPATEEIAGHDDGRPEPESTSENRARES